MELNKVELHEWYYFYSDWHKGIVVGCVKALTPPPLEVVIDHVAQMDNLHPSWKSTAEFYANASDLICRFGDVCQTCGARLEGFIYEPRLINLPTTESHP